MVLPQVADGAERIGDKGVVRGRQRRTVTSLYGAAAPTAMVAAAAQQEQEGNPENAGGSIPTARGLTESIHMDGLETSPQGVARKTNGDFLGSRSFRPTVSPKNPR